MWSRCFSLNATTTCSRNDKLLFMNYASNNCYPWLPVFLVRSDPARSTRFNLLTDIFSLLSTRDRLSTNRVKRQWDLLECLFSLCSLIVLFISPSKYIYRHSSSLVTSLLVRPLTNTYPRESSYITRLSPPIYIYCPPASRSSISSLYISR